MLMVFRSALLTCIVSVVMASVAFAQFAQPTAVQRNYVLGSGDVVQVEVLGQADFGTPRVKIAPDGTIPLPVIGTIQAGGLTTQQLAAAVRNKLVAAQYYNNPTVNVDIATYASRYVIVLGDVAQPGLVPIDRPYRVSYILARVGGLKDNAADYVVLSPVASPSAISTSPTTRKKNPTTIL